MKTAHEMRETANTVLENAEISRINRCIGICDEVIAPCIEKAANLGGYKTWIDRSKFGDCTLLDYEYIRNLLELAGYKVKAISSITLEISW